MADTTRPSPWSRVRSWTHKLRRRRAVRWSMDLLLLLIVILGVGIFQTRHHPRGIPLPEMTLQALSGAPFLLPSVSGRPTVLVIWAPWCGVCKAESSNLSRVQGLVGDRARVISIAVGFHDLGQVRAFVRDQEVDYPVLLGNDALLTQLRIEAYPTLFFLDARGQIKASTVGYTTTAGILLRLLL